MKPYDWDEQKNSKLKAERMVSFEDVVDAISDNRLLSDAGHPNNERYVHQRLYVVRIEDYAYLVPYVEDDEKTLSKTVASSRVATRKYLKGEQ